MKPMDILMALEEIDEEFIEQAAPHKGIKVDWLRYAAMAAAALILTAAGMALYPQVDNLPMASPSGVQTTTANSTTTSHTEQKTIVGETASTSPGQEGSYIVPRWEDKTLTQRFPEAVWEKRIYGVAASTIPVKEVGTLLATVVVQGRDVYTDTMHTATVTLYAIRGIATRCAVAVQYAGDTAYYPARNSDYCPTTLGEFLDDLHVRENVTFGKAHYGYVDEGKYVNVYSAGAVSPETIFSYLLSDPALVNVYDQQAMYVPYVSVSVDMSLLGYENISLWVTEDGYVVTNILDTGKAFYIGKDEVDAFVYRVLGTLPATPSTTGSSTQDSITSSPYIPTTTKGSQVPKQ